ncbi:MAG: 30S ribosome-binding factor RbfA [Chloroflexota bacterium]|nr:30S ribosome-binding factor RbfA [Chloroflexota bacterium]MDE2969338.1 30S ribosome-binding factor RbfA [Chloroflexota bacterium]
MSRRMGRVNELIREELSVLLLHELKDPRIVAMTTVTHVETSPDLEHARVFVSVMGTEDERAGAMQGLKSAEGFLRRSLAGRVKMRRVPALNFALDTSMEEGAQMLELIDRVADGHGAHQERRL